MRAVFLPTLGLGLLLAAVNWIVAAEAPPAPAPPAGTQPAGLWPPTVDYAHFTILRKLTGHTGRVNGMAFSPDFTWLLTGSDDATARLWEVTTGVEILKLTGFGTGITCVAISQDVKRAAMGGEDGTAWLYELPTGKQLAKVPGTAGIISVTFLTADAFVLERWAPGFGPSNLFEIWQWDGTKSTLVLSGGSPWQAMGNKLWHTVPKVVQAPQLSCWDATTGIDRLQNVALQAQDGVFEVSPDGRYVATFDRWGNNGKIVDTSNSASNGKEVGFSKNGFDWSLDSRFMLISYYTDWQSNQTQIRLFSLPDILELSAYREPYSNQKLRLASQQPVVLRFQGYTAGLIDPANGHFLCGLGDPDPGTGMAIRDVLVSAKGDLAAVSYVYAHGSMGLSSEVPMEVQGVAVPRYNVEIWGVDPSPPVPLIDAWMTAKLNGYGLKDSIYGRVLNDGAGQVEAWLAEYPNLVNANGLQGATPLHFAVATGRQDVVKVLLAAGADPDRNDLAGISPMLLAVRNHDLVIVKLLVAAGGDVLGSKTGVPNTKVLDAIMTVPPKRDQRGYQGIAFQGEESLERPEHLLTFLAEHGAPFDPRQSTNLLRSMIEREDEAAGSFYAVLNPQRVVWIFLLEIGLAALGFSRFRQARKKALDLNAQAEAINQTPIHSYQGASWGDDGDGVLGLYPEEQRELAALKHRSTSVLAAPLFAMLPWLSILGFCALHPVWKNSELGAGAFVCMIGLISVWGFNYAVWPVLRLIGHIAGILVGAATGLYALGLGLWPRPLFDPWVHLLFLGAAITSLCLIWPYASNLKLMFQIVRMDSRARAGRVKAKEDLSVDKGWDDQKGDLM